MVKEKTFCAKKTQRNMMCIKECFVRQDTGTEKMSSQFFLSYNSNGLNYESYLCGSKPYCKKIKTIY